MLLYYSIITDKTVKKKTVRFSKLNLRIPPKTRVFNNPALKQAQVDVFYCPTSTPRSTMQTCPNVTPVFQMILCRTYSTAKK